MSNIRFRARLHHQARTLLIFFTSKHLGVRWIEWTSLCRGDTERREGQHQRYPPIHHELPLSIVAYCRKLHHLSDVR